MTDTGYKALIVDDDEFLLDIYSAKFTEKGVNMKSAASGEAALDVLREDDDFDLILLDVVMPSMNGLELLSKIREEKLAQGAAIVVLSNQGQQSDIDKAQEYNIDGYIVKASSVPSEVLEEALEILKAKKPASKS